MQALYQSISRLHPSCTEEKRNHCPAEDSNPLHCPVIRRDTMARKTPVSSSSDQLLDEFQALVRDTESLLQHSASLAGEQAEELREQMRSTLHNAEDALHARGKAAIEATEGYVQTHPWQTLGIAAAIGLLLGMLITRR